MRLSFRKEARARAFVARLLDFARLVAWRNDLQGYVEYPCSFETLADDRVSWAIRVVSRSGRLDDYYGRGISVVRKPHHVVVRFPTWLRSHVENNDEWGKRVLPPL